MEDALAFDAAVDEAAALLPALTDLRDRLAAIQRRAEWWGDHRWSSLTEAVTGVEMTTESLQTFTNWKQLRDIPLRDPESK